MSVSSDKSTSEKGGFRETVTIIVHALILALIVRTFLFQPFNIPSGSMKDTLLIGDYLFVSKYAYGYSRFSIPYAPDFFDGRIWAGAPKRGDIAVFRNPRNERVDFIKRVIGLPGDRIQMKEGLLYINGEMVPREHVRTARSTDTPTGTVEVYRETLPNGVSYETLDVDTRHPFDNTQVFEVPEGHFFMMGDNRDNSSDSRSPSAVGYVPVENFVGRAEIIFFSVREGSRVWELWNWPWSVRADRLFKLL